MTARDLKTCATCHQRIAYAPRPTGGFWFHAAPGRFAHQATPATPIDSPKEA